MLFVHATLGFCPWMASCGALPVVGGRKSQPTGFGVEGNVQVWFMFVSARVTVTSIESLTSLPSLSEAAVMVTGSPSRVPASGVMTPAAETPTLLGSELVHVMLSVASGGSFVKPSVTEVPIVIAASGAPVIVRPIKGMGTVTLKSIHATCPPDLAETLTAPSP
jgi:hypothetical protein